jgi:hypothetical protein
MAGSPDGLQGVSDGVQMSEEHTNLQKYVIVISNPQGRIWVIGTDTQRGFTEVGASRAEAKLEAALPHGWNVAIRELYPVGEALASNRR